MSGPANQGGAKVKTARASLRPLTDIERTVAEENLFIVDRFLKAKKLSYDEWFDIVIFRYLLSVENWFRRPELWQLSFSTIAWKAMQSAVGHEIEKRHRRIRTVSIDSVLSGTDDLTINDIITDKNLDYICYSMEVYDEDNV